jgi:CheY-specific phosphatase CheX
MDPLAASDSVAAIVGMGKDVAGKVVIDMIKGEFDDMESRASTPLIS